MEFTIKADGSVEIKKILTSDEVTHRIVTLQARKEHLSNLLAIVNEELEGLTK